MCQETGNPQSLTHPRPAECDSRQKARPFKQNGPSIQKSSKEYAPSGTSPKWTCLPPGSTTNYRSLCHWSQIPRPGQWMHSVCPGKIWTHMPSHQHPSWAKWCSCRTTYATGSLCPPPWGVDILFLLFSPSDVRCPASGVRRPMSGVTHGFRSFKGKVLELLSPNLVCRLIGSVACLGLLLAVVPLLLTE